MSALLENARRVGYLEPWIAGFACGVWAAVTAVAIMWM